MVAILERDGADSLCSVVEDSYSQREAIADLTGQWQGWYEDGTCQFGKAGPSHQAGRQINQSALSPQVPAAA